MSLIALPLFLGILAIDELDSRIAIKLHVYRATQELLKHYPDDVNLHKLNADLKYGDYYGWPASMHITTFYIGDNPDAEDSEYFKQFIPNLNQDMIIHAIAICPKRVITCVMSRKDYSVPIQNAFPHMTALLGNWTAVDSNVLMESLFGTGMPLESVYDQLFMDSPTNRVWNTLINGKNEHNIGTYVVQFANKLIVKGMTQYGYD